MFDENTHSPTVETLDIDILSCRHGWLDFKIKTEPQENTIHASAVFNIFPNLLAWLESIITGVQECSFDVDEERNRKKLSAIYHSNNIMLFKLQNHAYDTKEDKEYFEDLVTGYVDTYDFIRTFYTAFTDFYQSGRYDKKTNDASYLHRRFEKKFGKSMHDDEVMDTLLALNAKQLRCLFLGIEFANVNFIRDGHSLKARFLETIRIVMQQKYLYEDKSPYWFEDFDVLSPKAKVDYILNAFHEDVSEASYAFNLQDFRSKSIETYLLSRSKKDYFHRDTFAIDPHIDTNGIFGIHLSDIKINGVDVFSDLCLNIEAFLDSTKASGTYPLFVCGCGDEGCGGVFESPKVTVKEETIVWKIYQPEPYYFRFDKQRLLEQAKFLEGWTKMKDETVEKRFFPRIQECYLHGIWDFLDEQALDYTHAIEFEGRIKALNMEVLGFKPTKAELWSGDAQKRILFRFEPLEDTTHQIRALTLYVSAVAPAMLILTTIVNKDNIPVSGVENLELYDVDTEHSDPWKILTKELGVIAGELNIERCTIEEHRKYIVPFVLHYDWCCNSNDDELEFLEKDVEKLSPVEIKLAKSYPPKPVDVIDCLFAQDYYFV